MKNKLITLGILAATPLVSAASPFTEVGGQLLDRITSGILVFGLVIFIISVIGWLMWWFLIYRRKFNIDVKIISKRAQDKHNILFDQAAIIYDKKDGSNYFSLWKLKKNFTVPDFNILQTTSTGDYFEMYRTGEDTFYFLLPPKIDKKYLIKSDGKIVPIAEQSSRLIDPDLAFWAAKRKSLNRSMFDPEKLWMKILPYIPHIVSGVLVIFILWILMSRLPQILAELRTLAAAINQRTVADVTTGLFMNLI